MEGNYDIKFIPLNQRCKLESQWSSVLNMHRHLYIDIWTGAEICKNVYIAWS